MPFFCGKKEIQHRVNWERDTSLQNWYEQLNLACESKAKVGFIGSSLFIGWSISAFILPRIADIVGRRPVFMLSMFIQTIAFTGLFLSRSIYVNYAFMFLFGTASVGRCSISFLYLMELLPKAQQILVGTILQVHNSVLVVFGCIYFWKISKNWIWLELYACISGVIAMICTFFMPESPKFLITKNKYDEAR
jgi:MFS family permease